MQYLGNINITVWSFVFWCWTFVTQFFINGFFYYTDFPTNLSSFKESITNQSFFVLGYYILWEIEIAHSHVTMPMTKMLCCPQTKEVTIINVLIKNWPISHKTFNKMYALIFPRYCTYLLICCVIYLNIWLHCGKCTDNWQLPWNDPWSRTARMVQRNKKRKVRQVY